MTCTMKHTYPHAYDGRVVICEVCGEAYSFTNIKPDGIELSHSTVASVVMRKSTPMSIQMRRETPMRIYTDGSCKSDGTGGWGWWNETTDACDSGGIPNTTNQKMELEAAIQALRHYVNDDRDIVIVSDSAYLVNGMQEKWYMNWIQWNWHTAKGKPVENRELWQKLVELTTKHGRVTWEKVRGHSGDPGNDRADKLASNAALLRQSQPTPPKATTFEFYVEGHGLFDYLQWNQEINLDWDRFKTDDTYADLVSTHVARTLENLAREVEEIGVVSPPDGSSEPA